MISNNLFIDSEYKTECENKPKSQDAMNFSDLYNSFEEFNVHNATFNENQENN